MTFLCGTNRLKVELVVAEGLSSPTSMAFVDNNIILVLEKNSGEVRLVSNGILQEEPVGLDARVVAH
jgi:glucose/arabinose dehydrogenase